MPPLVKIAMHYFLFSLLYCHLLCSVVLCIILRLYGELWCMLVRSGAPWRLFLLSIMVVAVCPLN